LKTLLVPTAVQYTQ